MNLYSPGTIRYLKEKHGFRFSKGLGQNFLTDPSVPADMVEGAGICGDDLVIEIGPGIGVLTAEAARAAGHVTAVEVDERLIPILGEALQEFSNIDIVNSDIMKENVGELIRRKKEEFGLAGAKILGNLPYYITTPIIMKLLEEQVPADSITVMMQKEVADRIRSAPGSRTYGAISVAVQYYCRVDKITDVPKEAFIPRPKVASTVLNLEPLEERIEVADEKIFLRCVKAGFAQRRKTLLNSLAAGSGMDKDHVRKILETAGIDPGRRAETLTVEEFGRIANGISNEQD